MANKQQFSEAVVKRAQLDPDFILLVLKIVGEIISCLRKRNKSDNVSELVKNPGWLDRIYLRALVRRHCKEKRWEVYEALLEQAKELKEEEVKAMYLEQ